MSIIDSTVFEANSFGQLVLVEANPVREELKRAIAGFLAGYSGQTMTAYRIDLKFIAWLDTAGIGVFDAGRAHIELCARWSKRDVLWRRWRQVPRPPADPTRGDRWRGQGLSPD